MNATRSNVEEVTNCPTESAPRSSAELAATSVSSLTSASDSLVMLDSRSTEENASRAVNSDTVSPMVFALELHAQIHLPSRTVNVSEPAAQLDSLLRMVFVPNTAVLNTSPRKVESVLELHALLITLSRLQTDHVSEFLANLATLW